MNIAFAALSGLFTGGVLNALADRLPPLHPDFDGPFIADRRRTLAPWEWLPLLSFAGAMRSRRMVIANNRLRYPLLEAATAALFALSWAKYGAEPWHAGVACAFSACLLALGAIDVETRYLPFKLSIPTLITAMAISPVWLGSGPEGIATHGWWEGAAAAGAGFAFFYGIHLLGRVTGRPLMGDGDAYVVAATGALLGFQLMLVAFYITAVAGGLFAFAVLGARAFGYKTRVIPYGPYIVLGGLTALFYGRTIIDWSMRL